jgi:endoglucanase
MGEFGISGGTPYANKNTCKEGESLPTPEKKALWAKLSITAAETYNISWNYWGFTGVGGFEAASRNFDDAITWYEGFPAAFGL